MKHLTLALCIVAILSAAASAVFYFQIGSGNEAIKQQVILAEKRTADVQLKLTTAQLEITGLEKRLAELDNEVGDAKSKATAADSRTAHVVRENKQLQVRILELEAAAR